MQIQNLKDQHLKIYTMINDMNEIVHQGTMEQHSKIMAKNISQLAGVLKIHLSSEDKFLYPRMKEATEDSIREIASTYEAEMGDLNQRYAAFKTRFNTHLKIEADVEHFGQEYNKIIEQILLRLEKEDQDLYPMAEKL